MNKLSKHDTKYYERRKQAIDNLRLDSCLCETHSVFEPEKITAGQRSDDTEKRNPTNYSEVTFEEYLQIIGIG